MAPLDLEDQVCSDWKLIGGQLRLALDLFLAAIVLQLFLDQWLAVFLASARDWPFVMLFARVPDSIQLALMFLGGMMFLLAYRLSSGNLIKADRGMFVIGCGVVSSCAADILKVFFGRLRPDALLEGGSYGFHILNGVDGFDSFPSSHAAIAMSMAEAASLLWPRNRRVFVSAVVTLAFTRLLVGRHFCSDILAGLALGLGITALTQILFVRCGIQLHLASESDAERRR
jgi:membrane-associated phospholipid phosphatase